MKKVIIATKNDGKVREMKKILSGSYDEILSLKDAGIDIDVVEDADTFEGNARLKSAQISEVVDCDVVADDSGISVSALGGAPGVFSARYAGEHATDEQNNRLLIKNLQGIADRNAKYVCVISLARGGEEVAHFVGECFGEIIDIPAGDGGFGYDPYFYVKSEEATFAQIPLERKNQLSHRGIALEKLKKHLENS